MAFTLLLVQAALLINYQILLGQRNGSEQEQFYLFCMELTSKTFLESLSEKSGPVPVVSSNNKIREYYYKQNYSNPVSGSIVNRSKPCLRNKSLAFQQNSKIDIIKMRCFLTSNVKKAIASKELVRPKDDNDDEYDASRDYEEETDDCNMQKNQNCQIYLKRSRFEGRPATVFFQYPTVCGISNQLNSGLVFPLQRGEMRYKINGWQYKCIINSLEYNGFKACQSGSDWDIYFDIKGNKTKKLENMSKHQKISHFPGCWYIGRKDFLWRGIHKIKRVHPEAYDFVPMTYLLPGDFDRFQMARENASKDDLWIMKPAAAACGRGIRMIAKTTKVRNRKQYLISQYVDNPHLINNLKYDLRVYVVVTSYDPLRIYLFEDGLVRFATNQYTCKHKDISKRFIHLTNFSVNKHSKNFVKNENADADNEGSKWSFKALRKYYQSIGVDSVKLFKSIEDVIIKTCISAEPNMLDIHSKAQQKRNCCFELYGFDILIDANLKPWLMEVNVCPSLSSSSPMDRRIKHTLLVDLLNLIGMVYSSPKEQEKSRRVLKDNFYQFQGGKKIYSRNINSLDALKYQNCLQLLSPEDWLVLLESAEQLDRAGHFKCIFPLRDNIFKYESLFQFRRYYNIMLWKSMQSDRSYLDHIISV